MTTETTDRERPSQPGVQRKSRRRWAFEAVATLAAIVLMFAAVEAALRANGGDEAAPADDPYVGFLSLNPLFVPVEREDGATVMQTAPDKLQFFNLQSFPVKKESDAFRIFVLGGSTTYGHPYRDPTSFAGWMREVLSAAAPAKKWEVINCGGISYANYRLAVLMEELLNYEPDLFVLYSGHNEFLERRTYQHIFETPPVLRWVEAVLTQTRVFAALEPWLDPLRGRPAALAAEQSEQVDVLSGEVDAILDDVVGLEAYTRDDALRDYVVEHYLFNLERMIETADAADVPIVVVKPASNLRDMSPFKSEHLKRLDAQEIAEFERLYGEAEAALAAGNAEHALARIDAALEIDPRHAHALYLRGRALWALGESDEAKRAFTAARDEDIVPLRALTPMVEGVEEVAQDRDVPLVDFLAMIEAEAPHATPGDEHFYDHVHPLLDVNEALALAVIEEMAAMQLVEPAANWREALGPVRERVLASLTAADHAEALRNLSKVLLWSGKKEEAERLIMQAAELGGDDPETLFQAGAVAMEQGRVEEAIGYFQAAVEAEPTFATAHNNLGDALRTVGRYDEAIVHLRRAIENRPEYANAWNNLGLTLLDTGRVAQAQAAFERSIEINPREARAHNNLGLALLRQGSAARAIEEFRIATEVRPDLLEARINLAMALAQSGRGEEAVRHLNIALEQNPDSVPALFNLGLVYRSLDRPAEAREAFARVLEIQPDLTAARAQLQAIERR